MLPLAVVATKSELVCRGTVVQENGCSTRGCEEKPLPGLVGSSRPAVLPNNNDTSTHLAILYTGLSFVKCPHEGPKHISRDVKTPATRSMCGNRRED